MASKILVVEDTQSIREIIVFMLRGKGYEVLEAGDGQSGEETARRERPDLLILDAMLPKKTGFDLCASLRADPEFRDVRVLMLTAVTRDTGKDDDYWKRKSQADDFMSKPFKAADLMQRVERLLGTAPSPPA
jgi:two-component system alkaline phosphatase synthesis response regulator PhoP